MAARNNVKVYVYFGGYIIPDDWVARYSIAHKTVFRIKRDMSFAQFLSKLYQRLEVDINQFGLRVCCKSYILNGGRTKEMITEMTTDDDLQLYIDPDEGNDSIEVFVEVEPRYFDSAPPQVSVEAFDLNEPNNSQPQVTPDILAATQCIPNLGFENYCEPSGAREVHIDPYTINYGNLGRFVGESSGTRPNIFEDDDPIGDSLGPNSPVNSEPSENETDDEEDVDVHDVQETLLQHNEGIGAEAGEQPTLYESIPFFSMSFPEVAADSVDVGRGRYDRFYESDRGILEVGMVFEDKKRLCAAVRDHSIRFAKREFTVVESNKKIWSVKCKHSTTERPCRWSLRGIEKSGKDFFMITRYSGPHNCIMDEMSNQHRNLDRNYIATLMVQSVRDDPACKITQVQNTVRSQLGFQLSRMQAWYGLKRCRENLFGTWESSMNKLPKFMKALHRTNPDTAIEFVLKPTDIPTRKMIRYFFWAFKPCLDGFKFCRRVISVDGTHLYTKYKHKLLIAVCLDANQQVLPLAFALVDNETTAAWKWFFQMLHRHLISQIPPGESVCVISDRAPGIIRALAELPEYAAPHVFHRYCLRHVCSNFNKYFKSVDLKDLCYKAGSEAQMWKFNHILNVIKSRNVQAYNYLIDIDKEKWAFAHDGGKRCGLLTTNMSEAHNGVLKGTRRLPISTIVDLTFNRCVKYFFGRLEGANVMIQNGQLWSTYAYGIYKTCEDNSVSCFTTRFNQQQLSAEVMTRARPSGGGNNKHTVSLRDRTCTCGKWVLTGIPCSHVLHVCREWNMSASVYVNECYTVSRLVNTYAGSFQPVLSEHYWEEVDFELIHDPTLLGDRRRSRIRNEMDVAQTRARQQSRRDEQARRLC
ncbi:PREDICTED: uncharacterized protein LOC105976338 [Erythranthe guttata]|uniref:uncharacterized protein LOC105969876 n=1 Tax=Erythranthe guttata TaxID=4155 RepID=UPI00064E0A6F|nr:PREDICTED: uncharacterized protein LOC105969876 [Erythranthe guttata]XP_012857062.1 PREDICTED: uncharacterized protein LOC105976338 [Erythranthe guttata]|eukprot:XP_012850103.1 PREDICTED: uncharacterized protein LOC105969876 [Erythranthe guttata]